MSLDLDKTFAEMLAAAGDSFGKEWPKIEACAQRAFEAERKALERIARAAVTNRWSESELASELDDEGVALRDALLACKVRAKVATQQAINAALDVLKKAVKVALA